MNKTQTIAGHTITLEAGVCYIASIPGACPRGGPYEVNIRVNADSPNALDSTPVLTFEGLDYDTSHALLNEFNNDPRGSLYGRVW